MADLPISLPEGLDEFLSSPSSSSASEQSVKTQDTPLSSTPEPEGLNEFIEPELKEAKYGNIKQQAIAGLEGAAQGIAGPLAPLAEKAFGVSPEDILARQEANPSTHIASEIGGLIGSAVVGTGLGGALSKIGEAAFGASKAAGIGKVGSKVVQSAIENAAFQSGQEISKLVLNDPNQSVDTAVTDIGLASLIGGGFVGIPALWKAARGPETGSILSSIASKLGGIEGALPDAVEDAIHKSGMEISPEVRAGLSADPKIQQLFKILEQSDTTRSGQELQKSYKEFRKQAGDTLIRALGKTPEEVQSMGELSKYEAGKAVGNALANEYNAQLSPISKVFDDLKSKYKNLRLTPNKINAAGEKVPGTVAQLSDQISKIALNEGWATSPSSDIMKEVNRVINELPLQKNLKNLGDFISQVGVNTDNPLNGPLRRAGSLIKRVLKEGEAQVLEKKLGASEGPLAVSAFKQARAEYAAQSAIKDALDSRLHLKGSTSSYASRIKEMAKTDGESLLRRMSGIGDADLLSFIQEKFPKTAESLRNFHINDLLKSAADKANPDANVSNQVLLTKLNKMSPELKNFIIPPESLNKINAIDQILNEFNKLPHNFSNTARTTDKLLSYLPGSAVSLVGLLTGHNPVSSLITGALIKPLGKDAPDAVRLALLKFLGSQQRVSPEAFKTSVNLISHTIKGENLASKAAKNIFKPENEILPESYIPKENDRKQLLKSLDKINLEPNKLFEMYDKAAHYMPDHGSALAKLTASAVGFLNSKSPDKEPSAPLDTKIQPSLAEKAQYNRILDIAQQPLLVLKHIKDGTITPKDVEVQKTLYPNLYTRLSQKLTDNLIEAKSKGIIIPYKVRMGLSLYLGQAMDSTLTPTSIMSAQPIPNQPQQPQPKQKSNTNALSKLPNMYRTPNQDSENDKAQRHK